MFTTIRSLTHIHNKKDEKVFFNWFRSFPSPERGHNCIGRPLLLQIAACYLCGAKSLAKPIMTSDYWAHVNKISEIWIKMQWFPFTPFCLGLNVQSSCSSLIVIQTVFTISTVYIQPNQRTSIGPIIYWANWSKADCPTENMIWTCNYVHLSTHSSINCSSCSSILPQTLWQGWVVFSHFYVDVSMHEYLTLFKIRSKFVYHDG